MNTTLLHRNTAHPPDTDVPKTVSIPHASELQRLALSERLTLRLGLWLLDRSLKSQAQIEAQEIHHQHSRTTAVAGVQDPQRRALTEHEAITLLAYGLHQRSLL